MHLQNMVSPFLLSLCCLYLRNSRKQNRYLFRIIYTFNHLTKSLLTISALCICLSVIWASYFLNSLVHHWTSDSINLLMTTGCSGGTDKEGEAEALPSMARNESNVKSYLWEVATSRSKAYEYELETKARQGTLWCMSMIKGGLLTKPSSSTYRMCGAHRLLSCYETSATPTSAGGVAQQAIGHPGNWWSALRIT